MVLVIREMVERPAGRSMLIRYSTMILDGKSCTVILALLPPGHDKGIRLFGGALELADGAVYVREKESGIRVLLPPHLVARIEPVTDELREGYEIDFNRELCVRAYYNGRRRLKTLGWNAVLAQAEAAPAVE